MTSHKARILQIGVALLLLLSGGAFEAQAGTSTTALTASPNPAGEGQNVILTATVTGSAPTGSVTFKRGSTVLGTATVNASGVATRSTTFSSMGTYSLTASYGGDANNTGSTSPAVSMVVNRDAVTTTTLTATPSPAIKGQMVTLTATVTGNNPGGTVTFKNGTTTLGTDGINASGVATLNTSFATVGSYSLTATYEGDGSNDGSSSAATALTVNLPASSTTLSVSPNSGIMGEPVTLTATVTGSLPGGTVTFRDGTATLGTATIADVQVGVAKFPATFTTTGVHVLTATYEGDANNAGSRSADIALAVKARSSAVLTASPSPAGKDEAVTLTATVTGSAPTGEVVFWSDPEGAPETVLGSATVNASGIATLTTSFAVTGSYTLTAQYAGDANNTSSPRSPDMMLTVKDKTPTTTTLTVDENPVTAGRSVTLTAVVTGDRLSGDVTFKNGTETVGTASFDRPSADVKTVTLYASFTTGTHSLTAHYGGNSSNIGSSSAAVLLTANPTISTTVLTVSPNSVDVDQAVTLTATVTGLSPEGTVTFRDETTNTVLGTGAVNRFGGGNEPVSHIATLTVSFAAGGNRAITASYGDDGYHTASTSAAASLTVNKWVTSTTLNVPPATAGQIVTLRATVTNSVASLPTGTVTFLTGSTVLGTGTLNTQGVATFDALFTVSGEQWLTVRYEGDAKNAMSLSAERLMRVDKVMSSALLTSVSPSPAMAGQAVILTATITGYVPTGEVVFRGSETSNGSNTTVLGSAMVNASGVATLTTAFAQADDQYWLIASYGGDAANTPSESAQEFVTVSKAISSTVLTVTPISGLSAGDSVTLTATVTGSVSTGSVRFFDDTGFGFFRGPSIAEVQLDASGTAVFTRILETAGSHSFRAEYWRGDENNMPSESAVTVLEVAKAISSITITASPSPVMAGELVALVAVVTGSPHPLGPVTFTMRATGVRTLTGTVGASGGYTKFSGIVYEPGEYTVEASFGGDANNTASIATPISLTVSPCQ